MTVRKHLRRRGRNRSLRAFTLAETVFAAALFGLALYVLWALWMPLTGSLRQAREDNRTAILMSEIDAFIREWSYEEVSGWVKKGKRKILLPLFPENGKAPPAFIDPETDGLDNVFREASKALFGVILTRAGWSPEPGDTSACVVLEAGVYRLPPYQNPAQLEKALAAIAGDPAADEPVLRFHLVKNR